MIIAAIEDVRRNIPLDGVTFDITAIFIRQFHAIQLLHIYDW